MGVVLWVQGRRRRDYLAIVDTSLARFELAHPSSTPTRAALKRQGALVPRLGILELT
jgi:hypothetical protein